MTVFSGIFGCRCAQQKCIWNDANIQLRYNEASSYSIEQMPTSNSWKIHSGFKCEEKFIFVFVLFLSFCISLGIWFLFGIVKFYAWKLMECFGFYTRSYSSALVCTRYIGTILMFVYSISAINLKATANVRTFAMRRIMTLAVAYVYLCYFVFASGGGPSTDLPSFITLFHKHKFNISILNACVNFYSDDFG